MLDNCRNKPHNVHMKRELDAKEMANWKDGVGGWTEATRLIRDKLGCSDSKAEKIVSGSYPSLPSQLEQIAIAEVMGRPRDAIFPLRQQRRNRAS